MKCSSASRCRSAFTMNVRFRRGPPCVRYSGVVAPVQMTVFAPVLSEARWPELK